MRHLVLNKLYAAGGVSETGDGLECSPPAEVNRISFLIVCWPPDIRDLDEAKFERLLH